MFRCAAVCLLLAAALTGTTLAQSNTSTVRDPNALAVVQQAVTALGGPAAISQIQDCTATGTTQADAGSGLTSGSFRWENSGREFRYENPSSSGTQVVASGHGKPAVGDSSGKIRPLGRQVAVQDFPLHLVALVLRGAFRNPQTSLRMMGTQVVNGRQVNWVQIGIGASDSQDSSGNWQQWFFDVASGLPVMVVYRLLGDGSLPASILAGAQFSNYQTVSGVAVPFQIVTSTDGQRTSVVTLDSVVFNSGIAPSEFDLPAGGAQ